MQPAAPPRLALFGDSLLGIPWHRYRLKEKLLSLLGSSAAQIQIDNHCWNGAKIADLREALPALLNLRYDFVILLWDSDCSDLEEEKLTRDSLNQLRDKYYQDVVHVVSELKRSTRYFCFAGPVLLGEISVVNCCLPPRFQGKEAVLEDFCALNRRAAEQCSVDYWDVRSLFVANIPSWWPLTRHWITDDGEHFNDSGTQLVAQGMSEIVRKWLIEMERKV